MDNYSLSTWILRDVKLDQALSFLADSNFRIIELSGSGSALLNAWEEDCLALKEQLARWNLQISSIHCSTDARRALTSADREARENIIDDLNQADFDGERTVELKPFPESTDKRIAKAAEIVEMWRRRR